MKKMFTHQDVDIQKTNTLHEGFLKVNQYHLRFKLFQGGFSEVVMRELMERHQAVAVLPYDPVTDEVVMIEQFRIGAIHRQRTPWLLEIIAGMIDNEESIDSVVRREAMEEAGLTIEALQPMCDYLSSPGGSTERLHLYCAKVRAKNDGQIFGLNTENENIKVHVLSVEEAFARVNNNQQDDAASIIALQWLQHHKTELQEAWK